LTFIGPVGPLGRFAIIAAIRCVPASDLTHERVDEHVDERVVVLKVRWQRHLYLFAPSQRLMPARAACTFVRRCRASTSLAQSMSATE
jgi:hypothetical protein